MQIAKTSIILLALATGMCACGKGEKETRSAAESMKRNKSVRIVTNAVNLPFEFGSGTGVQGLDVDIGNEIAKDLGIEPKWIKIADVRVQSPLTAKFSAYDHLFELLANGEAEILISTIAIDPKRLDRFAFSQPYFDSGDTIAHRQENDYKDLASLSGKKVGVATGRSGESFMAAQKTAANVSIVKFASLDDALGALNRLEIDAVVGDEPVLTYSSYTSFPNITTTQKLLQQYQYAVVVRKDEKELLAKVNETLDRLKRSGELAALKPKWFKDVEEQARKKREKYQQEEALKKSPKIITVAINKIKGGREFNMDRLDGFRLVLERPGGQYQSTHIETRGDTGACKFTTPVPPGEYKLNMMKVFQTTASVTIPDLPKSSLTMVINVARDILITIK